MNNEKDFDINKIELININDVIPNEYNPKKKDTHEYKNVVKSIARNGLKQFIFIREEDGQKIIVDGEQRWTAAKELGYSQIYVYNLGEISEEEAKALTIWFEVQVPFDDIELAPIAIELSKSNIELPFTSKEMNVFAELAQVDFSDFGDEEPLETPEKMVTLTVQMSKEQFDAVKNKMKEIISEQNVSEGRALELLVADGIAGYMGEEIPEEDEELAETASD